MPPAKRSGSTSKSSTSSTAKPAASKPARSTAGKTTAAKPAASRSTAKRTATRSTASKARATSAKPAAGAAKAAKDAAAQADQRFEAAAARVRKLNERIIEAGREAGEATLTNYEKALKSIASGLEKGPGSSEIEWISNLATAQAKFIREMANSWTSAARDVLKN